MSQNGQAHFKNLAANGARFLKYVWPFWDTKHQEDSFVSDPFITVLWLLKVKQ